MNRLAKLQGQVRGLSAMVEGDREPADVLTLLAAIRAALDGVGTLVLTEHVECALMPTPGTEGIPRDEAIERVESIKRALARFVS